MKVGSKKSFYIDKNALLWIILKSYFLIYSKEHRQFNFSFPLIFNIKVQVDLLSLVLQCSYY